MPSELDQVRAALLGVGIDMLVADRCDEDTIALEAYRAGVRATRNECAEALEAAATELRDALRAVPALEGIDRIALVLSRLAVQLRRRGEPDPDPFGPDAPPTTMGPTPEEADANARPPRRGRR